MKKREHNTAGIENKQDSWCHALDVMTQQKSHVFVTRDEVTMKPASQQLVLNAIVELNVTSRLWRA
jgi:hypothetical protein